MSEFDFALDVKGIEDDGSIEGIAAAYGNVDHGGDIIAPGAIAKSLEGKSRVPMLLFHDQKRPIGAWTDFSDTSDGLRVKGRFSMNSAAGREAHAMARDGVFGGLSIGYRTLKHRFEGKARHLLDIALHEISLVTIPMNERTGIVSVKNLRGDTLPTLSEFEDHLREAGFSKTEATAVANKGLSHLLRGEPGSASDDEAREFLATLSGHSPA